jgi:hypothetical protein
MELGTILIVPATGGTFPRLSGMEFETVQQPIEPPVTMAVYAIAALTVAIGLCDVVLLRPVEGDQRYV